MNLLLPYRFCAASFFVILFPFAVYSIMSFFIVAISGQLTLLNASKLLVFIFIACVPIIAIPLNTT